MSAWKFPSIDERSAIVWATIERIAFSPSGKDRTSWMRIFALTLPGIWGVEPWGLGHLKNNDNFPIPSFPGMVCNFAIKDSSKFAVGIHRKGVPASIWHVETDPAYCSQACLSVPTTPYPGRSTNHLRSDVERVLDGMIFHPRCHSHLSILDRGMDEGSANFTGLDPHEIRLGGGIENPYVFLLHLRYQFCLVESIRKNERDRLILLFESAIRQKRTSIPPSELLGLKASGT